LKPQTNYTMHFLNIYQNNTLNKDAEHSKDSMLLVPCFPTAARPFFPVIIKHITLRCSQVLCELTQITEFS